MRFLLAALCLSLVPLAAAQADDPYTVTGVEIDATADNALQAQTAAMQQGQRAAARRLIERLTLAEDRVGTPLESAAFALDDAIIAEMISGLQIRDEQRSGTRYLAKLDVGFHRRSVARVLENYGIPFVDSPARATLVLPVLDAGGDLVLSTPAWSPFLYLNPNNGTVWNDPARPEQGLWGFTTYGLGAPLAPGSAQRIDWVRPRALGQAVWLNAGALRAHGSLPLTMLY